MPKFDAPGSRAIANVSRHLGSLSDDVVFIGGAVLPLLATDDLITRFRETRDVDAIVEVSSRAEYWTLEEAVRRKGFEPDEKEGAPIGRFRIGGLILDLMPTDPNILGFGNRWYDYAIESAIEVHFPDGIVVHVVNAPAFIATKLDAFDSRGRGDFFGSHDLEDVVTLLDARAGLSSEVGVAPREVRSFLAERAAFFLESDDFRDALPGHVEHGPATAARVRVVIRRLETISDLV